MEFVKLQTQPDGGEPEDVYINPEYVVAVTNARKPNSPGSPGKIVKVKGQSSIWTSDDQAFRVIGDPEEVVEMLEGVKPGGIARVLRQQRKDNPTAV